MLKKCVLEFVNNFVIELGETLFVKDKTRTGKAFFLHKTKNIYYLFLICTLACKPAVPKKEKIEIKKLNNNNNNNNVKISGISDEKGFNKSITFHDDSLKYVSSFKNVKKEIKGNSITRILKNIKNPKLLEFNSFGENTFYETKIIVTPGDSVNYTLKKGLLKFTGKNQEHYNFYLEITLKSSKKSAKLIL